MNETKFDTVEVTEEPKRKTRLQQLKEERDYLITQLGRRQAQIILIESDPAWAAKLEELGNLDY